MWPAVTLTQFVCGIVSALKVSLRSLLPPIPRGDHVRRLQKGCRCLSGKSLVENGAHYGKQKSQDDSQSRDLRRCAGDARNYPQSLDYELRPDRERALFLYWRR